MPEAESPRPSTKSSEAGPPVAPVKSGGAADSGGPASPAKSGGASQIKGPVLDENSLARTILRRGLATQQEIEACKGLKVKNPDKNLLELMVAANVLTRGQAVRVARETGEGSGKVEIPGYQLLDKLGKGSMGIVYKARQTSVDRIVAVKVLLEALAQNREFISRFQREAKLAAKLSHNNIVNAIDAGQVGNLHFFVMEYVEGRTIKDELDGGKLYEEREALDIVSKIADALKHAHQRGLIHRDIKPENIILTKEGGVKLADLGLARPTGDETWALSEAGMAIGTPYYISPEQVRGQVDIDIRADIYGLGGTLYHMVTGRVPYPGESPNEVMKKHVDEACELTPPDHLNSRLSSGLGEVVETMLAKDRGKRYKSPDDLQLDLKCLLAGERPMIAAQKADDLARLAEGDDEDEEERAPSSVTEEEKAEMAAIVNARTTIIAVLAILLGLSMATNVVLLLAR